MPESFDAATILAPGREILDIFTEYVTACRILGHHHHDLTRLHEWYDTEDGLDLRAIEGDQRALRAAAQAAEQALSLQDKQLRLVDDGWQGGAALAAREHLARHQTAAGHTVTALHTAAVTLNRLRDSLCEALTRKVTATVQIEGRRGAQRAEWLAAARTVTAGMAGDRSAASELIDQEVRPFVADDIAGDWIAAMRSATDAVADAYADAVAALRAGPIPVFGPALRLDAVRIGATPAHEPRPAFERTIPAGHSAAEISWPTAPPAAPPVLAAPAPPSVEVARPAEVSAEVAPPAEVTPPAAAGQSTGLPGMGGVADPGLGGVGSGLSSGVGSGLAGAGQQLADLFGGLIGSAAEGLPEADVLDGAPADGLDDLDDPEEPEELSDPEEEETAEEEPADEEPADESIDEATGEATGEPAEAAEIEEEPVDAPEIVEPQKEPPEPVAPPSPITEPLAQPEGETPCEIAADELPQVGS